MLTGMFRSQLPTVENTNFIVEYNALKGDDAPATLTQNEMMRRMKDMAAMQPGMNFYGQMPDMYSLVVNTEQPAVRKVVNEAAGALTGELTPLRRKVDELNEEITSLRTEIKEKKEEDKAEAEQKIAANEKEAGDLRKQQEDIIAAYAAKQPVVRQIIDLALLKGNMLKGEELSGFIARSVTLL